MKNDAKILQDEIKQLNNQIDGLNDMLGKVKQQLADLECKFKVGDRIAYGDQHYEVTRIGYCSYGEHYLYGKKIKKNGTPGLLEQCLYFWDKKKVIKL